MQMNLLFPDICDLELGETCGKLAEANSFAMLLTGGNRAPITLCLCLLRFTGHWAAAEVPMHAAASSTDCSVSNLHPPRCITKNVTAALFKHQLISLLDCKEIQPVHPKGDQAWVFIGRTDAEAETPILRPPHVKSWLVGKARCWEGLGAGGEGDDRGWDGWMASPTRWPWVWVNSGSWWWTGRPGVLWFMGLQKVRYGWATELNWTEFLF